MLVSHIFNSSQNPCIRLHEFIHRLAVRPDTNKEALKMTVSKFLRPLPEHPDIRIKSLVTRDYLGSELSFDIKYKDVHGRVHVPTNPNVKYKWNAYVDWNRNQFSEGESKVVAEAVANELKQMVYEYKDEYGVVQAGKPVTMLPEEIATTAVELIEAGVGLNFNTNFSKPPTLESRSTFYDCIVAYHMLQGLIWQKTGDQSGGDNLPCLRHNPLWQTIFRVAFSEWFHGRSPDELEARIALTGMMGTVCAICVSLHNDRKYDWQNQLIGDAKLGDLVTEMRIWDDKLERKVRL